MHSLNLIAMITLYTVLVMVLVSLDVTYSITHSLFGHFLVPLKMDYGVGMSIKNVGFLLHVVVFALLIVLPMLIYKDWSNNLL